MKSKKNIVVIGALVVIALVVIGLLFINNNRNSTLSLADLQKQKADQACLAENPNISEDTTTSIDQFVTLAVGSAIRDLPSGSQFTFKYATFEPSKITGSVVFEDQQYGSYNVSLEKSSETKTKSQNQETLDSGGWEVVSLKPCTLN